MHSGKEVFLWGQNTFGQLVRGDGKKGNSAVPIRPRSADDSNQSYQDTPDGENARLRLSPMKMVKVNGRYVTVSEELALGHNLSVIYNRLF